MSTRLDFIGVLARNRRRMDAERREFARQVLDVVARNSPGERFDQLAYVRTRQQMVPVLDTFYGMYPGDRRARFWRLMANECRAARVLAFQRAMQDVRQRLRTEPALIRSIREAA